MKLKELNLSELLVRYESEMFGTGERFEIANVCEFELFSKDENNIYCLQFNRDDETYSITIVEYETFNKDTVDEYEDFEEVYLETYPMDLYNREFLTSRIVKYITMFIENTGLTKWG